jgi:hypothetical protein
VNPDPSDERAIDEEHTKLVIYRRAYAAADERFAAVDEVGARLIQLAGHAPAEAIPAGLTFSEGIGLASTELMMSQSTYRAAVRSVVDPVQLSLRDFLA